MLEQLKEDVCEANRRLVADDLVVLTFGNASGVDRAGGHVVIKPSGVSYDALAPEQMVVVSLETGKVVEGALRPSSDAPTHLALYRAFPGIGGVVHTHSFHATAWAQAGCDILVFGTTHADLCRGPVPCTRLLRPDEVAGDYEAATGRLIVERFDGLDPAHVPCVLVAGHGPFAWGDSPADAVHNAVMLEYVARLAAETVRIQPYPRHLPRGQIEKHFLRKHGPDAYYGQT